MDQTTKGLPAPIVIAPVEENSTFNPQSHFQQYSNTTAVNSSPHFQQYSSTAIKQTFAENSQRAYHQDVPSLPSQNMFHSQPQSWQRYQDWSRSNVPPTYIPHSHESYSNAQTNMIQNEPYFRGYSTTCSSIPCQEKPLDTIPFRNNSLQYKSHSGFHDPYALRHYRDMKISSHQQFNSKIHSNTNINAVPNLQGNYQYPNLQSTNMRRNIEPRNSLMNISNPTDQTMTGHITTSVPLHLMPSAGTALERLATLSGNTSNQQPGSIVKLAMIDDIKVPCILRSEMYFVSVRVVEVKFLSHFPDTYPEEIKQQPPLKSTPISQKEAAELDNFNKDLHYEYGIESFQNDLIVCLDEFKRFYSIIKQCFSKYNKCDTKSVSRDGETNLHERVNPAQNNIATVQKIGGWMQINNTVIPYVLRDSARYIPICVIKYAAGLTLDETKLAVLPTPKECNYFNNTCKSAGLNFTFDSKTLIGTLTSVVQTSNKTLVIKELPPQDPFAHASYDSKFEKDDYDSTPFQTKGNDILKAGQNSKTASSKGSTMCKSKTYVNPVNSPDGSSKLQTQDSNTSRNAYTHPIYSNKHNIPSHGKNNGMKPMSATTVLKLHDMTNKFSKNSIFGIPNPSQHLMQKKTGTSNSGYSNVVEGNMELADDETICSRAKDNCTMLKKLLNFEETKPNSCNSSEVLKGKTRVKAPILDNSHRTETIPLKSTQKITSMKIMKKTISVIRGRDGENYALVEALSRVFFPELPLVEFVNAVEKVLLIDIIHCTAEEEREFISFYDLPTVTLKCNKMVKIDVFKEYLAPLTYMFKHSNVTESDLSSNSKSTIKVFNQRSFEREAFCSGKRKKDQCIRISKKLKVCLVDVVKENLCHDICKRYKVKFKE